MISVATFSSIPRPWNERSVPFGKYSRRSPLVFSLLPRCQGECGSQKQIGIPVAIEISWWRDISAPWSQVVERRRCSGRAFIAVIMVAATVRAVWSTW